jgi:hypothetical protein
MINVGYIAHETLFTMDVLKEILMQNNNKAFFVPLREQIDTNGIFPSDPKGLKTYRGNNKYNKLVSRGLNIIFTFSLDDVLIEELLHTHAQIRLKIIVLLSRTSVNDYHNLSKTNKSKLSTIIFIDFCNSELKSIDGCVGTGESVVKAINKLNVDKTKNILLIGYGMTGSGIAQCLSDNGYYNMTVNDTDSVKSAIAQNSGLKVGKLKDLAKNADVVIDATGYWDEYLTQDVLDSFYKSNVTIISSSSKLHIQKINGYVNRNGTSFNIPESKGMCNMSYGIGGSSNCFMRVTGLTVLYFCLNYNNISNNIHKYFSRSDDKNPNSLYILNDVIEKQISNYVLKNKARFGGPVQQFYSSKYLSKSELNDAIVNKTGIHASFSSSDSVHKIYYKSDGTFEIDAIENGYKLGTTAGTYRIKKSSNYDIGLIDVKYKRIFESSSLLSPFNRKNSNSVFKTMKDCLGPFIREDAYGNACILNYSSTYYESKLAMTMHNNE